MNLQSGRSPPGSNESSHDGSRLDKDQRMVERYHVVSLTSDDSNVPRINPSPSPIDMRMTIRPDNPSDPNRRLCGLVLRNRCRYDGRADRPSLVMSLHDKQCRKVGRRDGSSNAQETYKVSPRVAVEAHQHIPKVHCKPPSSHYPAHTTSTCSCSTNSSSLSLFSWHSLLRPLSPILKVCACGRVESGIELMCLRCTLIVDITDCKCEGRTCSCSD